MFLEKLVPLRPHLAAFRARISGFTGSCCERERLANIALALRRDELRWVRDGAGGDDAPDRHLRVFWIRLAGCWARIHGSEEQVSAFQRKVCAVCVRTFHTKPQARKPEASPMNARAR